MASNTRVAKWSNSNLEFKFHCSSILIARPTHPCDSLGLEGLQEDSSFFPVTTWTSTTWDGAGTTAIQIAKLPCVRYIWWDADSDCRIRMNLRGADFNPRNTSNVTIYLRPLAPQYRQYRKFGAIQHELYSQQVKWHLIYTAFPQLRQV
jgi:hypothetical protein